MSANEPNYPPQTPAGPEGQTIADRPAYAESAPLWRPEVTGGVMAAESVALLKGFFKARRG